MQHSGFFNSLSASQIDRKYNADDYRNNLAVVISSGVLRSTNDDLKVTASGLACSVGVGRAWINGGYYYNDTAYAFNAVQAPVGNPRIDAVALRFDNTISSRKIELVYLQGTPAATPSAPTPTRTSTIYDLILAHVRVNVGATSVTVTDKRSDTTVCGWVYSTSGDNSFFTSLDNAFNTWFQDAKDTLSSVTLFKKYTYTRTLTASTNRVSFSIPQYDDDTCFIEVYVNGIYDSRHTIENTEAVFEGTLTAGTKVIFNCYKSIDGTGIMDVAEEITILQNKVAALENESTFTYKCTGTNDNWSLSQIADALYNREYSEDDVTAAALAFLTKIGGQTYLNSLTDNSQVTIRVVGQLGATTPVYGSGTEASRYRWFSFGQLNTQNKRIIFDFAQCDSININCSANKYNIIFYGTDMNIKNAVVTATYIGTGCHIDMIAGSYNTGKIYVENCDFTNTASGLARIAENGTFINCKFRCYSLQSHALCFVPRSASFIRVIGGTFHSYTKASGQTAAIFYTYSTDTEAVALATNISAPTDPETGWSQQYLAVGYGGKILINGVVSTQTTSGTYVEVSGQIWKTKR